MSSRAPSTIITEVINGRNEFTIPFEFLARKFVVVTLVGIDRLVLTLNTNYRFVSSNRIQLFQAVDESKYPRIELRRSTSTTDRLVTFVDGSILRATDMNLAQVQTMHVAEEARDLTADTIGVNDEGHLDARNRKIVNLANGEANLDAANMGQLRQFDTSTANNADRAEANAVTAQAANAQAQAAKDSANASEAAANNWANEAYRHATDAASSERKALGYSDTAGSNATTAISAANQALQHLDNATIEANRAKSEADRAKTEADKLQNNNEFAGCIEGVDPATNKVRMKGRFETSGTFVAYDVNDFIHKHGALAVQANDIKVLGVRLNASNITNGIADFVWMQNQRFTGGAIEVRQDTHYAIFEFRYDGWLVAPNLHSDGGLNVRGGATVQHTCEAGNFRSGHPGGQTALYHADGNITRENGASIFDPLGRSSLAEHLHNSITDHWYGQTEIVFIGETQGGGTNPGNGRVMVGVWMARAGSNSFMQDAYFRATWVRYNNGAEKIVASF